MCFRYTFSVLGTLLVFQRPLTYSCFRYPLCVSEIQVPLYFMYQITPLMCFRYPLHVSGTPYICFRYLLCAVSVKVLGNG